ncbi:MAG: hypothetical protein M1299_09225 [Firmicutes bacterium]|nr:hypothetical protein [Bacillota bacterium]
MKGRTGDTHPLGGLLLIQGLQVLEPDGFQFFHRQVYCLRGDDVPGGLKA